jgi:PAS domain S-box-containing protein
MNEHLYKSIIEKATDAVIVTDTEQRIIFINDTYVAMTGYSKVELIGKHPKILQGPETDQNELDKLRYALENCQPGYAELVNYKKSGEKFWTSIAIFPVNDEVNDQKYWVGVKRDITEHKKTCDELNTLLRELHHRVKNNLAIISAMMQLQALEAGNEIVTSALLDSTTRIKTIADIHEHLYQAKSLSNIDLGEYFIIMVQNILNTMELSYNINLQFSIVQIETLNINQAVPFSLIVNEVITNIAKHAFVKIKNGKIEINLSQKGKTIFLHIKDNGRGLPKDFNPRNITTTGMQLINTLAEQLKADFHYRNRKTGASFKLQFLKRDVKGAYSGSFISEL